MYDSVSSPLSNASLQVRISRLLPSLSTELNQNGEKNILNATSSISKWGSSLKATKKYEVVQIFGYRLAAVESNELSFFWSPINFW